MGRSRPLSEYKLNPNDIGPVELEVAASILVHAAHSRKTTVELRDVGASPYAVGITAMSALLQQQIGEALQEGRLRIVDAQPDTSATADDETNLMRHDYQWAPFSRRERNKPSKEVQSQVAERGLEFDRWLAKQKANAEAVRLEHFAGLLKQGWRLDADRLWKPKDNDVWVAYLLATASMIRGGQQA